MNQFDYDLAIIGGGSGGYAAARTAASAGLRTVVIEGGEEVGGLCILRGCMPTKALLYAADVIHLARHAGTWGIHTKNVGFDFSQLMARKNAMIKNFADDRRQQLTTGQFKFIRALARFIDPHSVELKPLTRPDGHPAIEPPVHPSPPHPSLSPDGGEGGRRPGEVGVHGAGRGEGFPRKITAKHFIISTGSVVAAPPLPQLKEIGYLTSDEALMLTQPPKSLIVLGGGPVAVEFAQFFARFNVEVTLVQRSEHLLRHLDTDAAIELEKVFRREGITLYANTKLTDAWREGELKGVTFEHEGKTVRVAAEEILFALGRIPNTGSLNLESAGVATEDRRIDTNAHMQTSASHIYAAGDCTGPHDIVHIAVQQGEIAAHNIVHPDKPRSLDYRLLTHVIFTDPQIGCVGLSEKDAAARNIPFLAASYPFNDHGKSLIMEALDGFVKLLAAPATGEIIGGSCIGPMGGELIHEIIAAMQKRMTVHELAAMPHYHPTLAEIWTYPAEELATRIRQHPVT